MSERYPFAAIVGQDALREALLWLAVDPLLGGVLVTGTRGTAKSTAVRGLVDLLPQPTPFVELPVGATEDRIVGTLDVGALLAGGERRFEPGLLARANGGVLYADEVNLLPDHLVDVLLDAAASGRNVVERDGASHAHDARFVLVGTMNPEEGELRPQLLDRFGLCVPVGNDTDVERRVEIVERRLSFELSPEAFAREFAAESERVRGRIVSARALLPFVVASRACVRRAAELALDARVEGMRADLTIVRAARVVAALDGRTAVATGDVERAAEPALVHRRREPSRTAPRTPPSSPSPPTGTSHAESPSPASQPSTANDTPHEAQLGCASRPNESEPASAPHAAAVGPAHDLPICGAEAKPSSEASDARDGDDPSARPCDVGAPASLALDAAARESLAARATPRDGARGRAETSIASGRAREVRGLTPRLAALATIRAAALERAPGATGALTVAPHHARYVARRGAARRLVVFAIDASGSMAAAARMRAAKGVVCALLEDAYRRRDLVALLAFRGADAEVLVPPTRSAVVAYRRLRTLPTGGRTPLAAGLRGARELVAAHARRDPGMRAHLVVVGDARATAPRENAFGEALHEAALLRATGLRALCVDTERGPVRLGQTRRLANELDATYRHLDECDERALGATVREWMATA